MGENNKVIWYLRQSFLKFYRTPILSQYNGPKPELWGRYINGCIGASSFARDELTQFTTAIYSFRPVLKYTWETSDTSLAFLDNKLSIEGNGLSTRVYYKPTESHGYLLYSSSHPLHVKNSIPFSQFLRLRRSCNYDSDFSRKLEAMKDRLRRGYPSYTVCYSRGNAAVSGIQPCVWAHCEKTS